MRAYTDEEYIALESAIEAAGENATPEYIESNIDNGCLDIVEGRSGREIADYMDLDGHEGHVYVDTLEELTAEELKQELY